MLVVLKRAGTLLMALTCILIVEISAQKIEPGAHQTEQYIPQLLGKRVGIFANHTATIGNMHLVDSLQKLGIRITKIFGPEHGFRGTADAGEKVDTYTDAATGIPVISLYGKKRKPSADDLADVDVLIFDIQDVGVRFYTFISSLEEFMESAAEFNKPLLVLDRPNPNGFYVDGPVLDTTFRSFVGMQPVPVVYGMTMGEYALMLLGEKWLRMPLDHYNTLRMQVVKCSGYTHSSKYQLPIKPSPNLPTPGSIYWYPSTCFFEGTSLSEGRGTDFPFQVFGHPSLPNNLYKFTPTSRDGAKSPKLMNQTCYGWLVMGSENKNFSRNKHAVQLKFVLEAYKLFPNKDSFFLHPRSKKPTDYFFNKLAGYDMMSEIVAGKTEDQIKAGWQPKLTAFKTIRKKYLLYPDFE